MVGVKEVPPELLIARLEEHIKRDVQEVKPPTWSYFVKTGRGRDAPPDERYWWYTRAASLLRKIYLNQPVGVQRLRSYYGGRIDRGVAPEHHADGGGSNIRKILQQLEDGGLLEKTRKGRVLTPKARALLDRLATEVSKNMDVRPWYEEYGSTAEEEKR